MKHVMLTLCMLLLCAVPAVPQWHEDGEAVADKPWAKSDGEFAAMLAFTDDPEQLYESWEEPTPGVEWSRTSTAVRGVPIVGVVFFTGCAANPDGKCDLVGRFIITTPSSKPWGDPIDAGIWVDLPPPSGGNLQLSYQHMGLIVEPEDELGVYTARLELMDRVSTKKMLLEQEFTAVEAPKDE